MVWEAASSLENRLPDWLDTSQLQLLQWIYALWQIIRTNPAVMLLLSATPFLLRQCWKKKTVVVLGTSRGFVTPRVADMESFMSACHTKTIEMVSKVRYWWLIKYKGTCYTTHQNTLCEIAYLLDKYGHGNVIFVDNMLRVTETMAVGRELSEKEAYEKIFTKRFLCGLGSKYVVPTRMNYVNFSSKLWGVLSTVPIFLQARSYNRLSNTLSLIIILLDLNRGWLYKSYDSVLVKITGSVKINIFKHRTSLYHFFSVFSNRWMYCDVSKKCSYVANAGDVIYINNYNKLKSFDDVEIVEWYTHYSDPDDDNVFLILNGDTAGCDRMYYECICLKVKLKRPIRVSEPPVTGR